MLQNKFEMPLDLVINNSRTFHIYLVVIVVLSFISIFISSIALAIQVLLVLFLLVMTAVILKKQKESRITSLKLSAEDKWEIEINHNQRLSAELTGECIVSYFLIWLNFTTSNHFGKKKTFYLLLLPDSADKDLLRRLRVRLRFLSQLNKKDKVIARDNAAIS